MEHESSTTKPPQVSDYKWTGGFLDDLFEYLGFSKKLGADKVRYVGERNGRALTVKVPTGLKTDLITETSDQYDIAIFFEVSSSLMTRLTLVTDESFGMGATEKLQQGYGNEKVEVDPAYNGFQVWAYDGPWTQGFLNNPAVKESLKTPSRELKSPTDCRRLFLPPSRM